MIPPLPPWQLSSQTNFSVEGEGRSFEATESCVRMMVPGSPKQFLIPGSLW